MQCPHCAHPDSIRYGTSRGVQRCRCQACRRIFQTRRRGKDPALKQQWRQRRVRGFPQLQATLQADLKQIVEKSGKAIVASCGYSSVLS